MLRVTVEIRAGLTGGSLDLEVPAELPAVELSRLIAAALKIDSDPFGRALRYEMRADPVGRMLSSWETLASAAVWDGATLTLTPLVAAYFESDQAAYPLYLRAVALGRAEAAVAGRPDDALVQFNGESLGHTVSRLHAQMIYGQNQWQLLHLSQTNRTLVNGQELAHDLRMALREGDRVELGGVALTFRFGFAPAPPLLQATPQATPQPPPGQSPYATQTI